MPVRYPPAEVTVGNFLAFPWVIEHELHDISFSGDFYFIINRRADILFEPIGLSDVVIRRADWRYAYTTPLGITDPILAVRGRAIEKGQRLYPGETTLPSDSLILPAEEPDVGITDSYVPLMEKGSFMNLTDAHQRDRSRQLPAEAGGITEALEWATARPVTDVAGMTDTISAVKTP